MLIRLHLVEVVRVHEGAVGVCVAGAAARSALVGVEQGAGGLALVDQGDGVHEVLVTTARMVRDGQALPLEAPVPWHLMEGRSPACRRWVWCPATRSTPWGTREYHVGCRT